MPLFYQQDINESTRLGVWKIEEPEQFFLDIVPLQRNITHPNKRLQHLAGRFLLKHLFDDFPYKEIQIAGTRKPFLPDEQYHFSISHCGEYAAAIVSRFERVGIDIEIPTEKVFRILHKFLHKEELMQFKLASSQVVLLDEHLGDYELEDTDPKLPTLLWSIKESIFKWWGWGEVDFSDAMRLSSFESKESGNLTAMFIKNEIEIPLRVHYRQWEDLLLTWTATEPDVIKRVD
jgi:phosphopantetheinyl transferase